MLEGDGAFGGGNVTLFVGGEYVVLIDDAMVPTVSALMDAATKVAGRPVDFVVNTHVHGDHVGGNEFVASTGALIVAHDNIRKRMQQGAAGSLAGFQKDELSAIAVQIAEDVEKLVTEFE